MTFPSRSSLGIIALASALFGSAIAANAQNAPQYPMPTSPAAANGAPVQGQPGAPRPHHKNRMRAALERLDLSSAQRVQIASAMQQFRASRSSATPMTRKQLRSNIESVLNPSQRTQFETFMRHRTPAPVPAAS